MKNNKPQHTPTDTAMENLAILDGMKRDGWSEGVIDRIERAVNAHEELVSLCQEFVTTLDVNKTSLLAEYSARVYKALAKAEGK